MAIFELMEKFKTELQKVGGEFFFAENINHVVKIINDIISKLNIKKIVIANNDKFKELKGINCTKTISSENYSNKTDYINTISDTDAGISFADYLSASTGTCVSIASNQEHRLISLLPETNIIIGYSSNILKDIDETMHQMKIKISQSNCITLITGPSRTADIEKVLVTGVHGPKRLFVIVLHDKT